MSTALDPAAPLFSSYDVSLDLDKTDAMFVDVVHSNAKPLQSGGVGLFKQVGHVDFYVNGGQSQPGCSDGVSAILAVFHGGKGHFACFCLAFRLYHTRDIAGYGIKRTMIDRKMI